MSKQETKPDTKATEAMRPVGLSISAFFYAASGAYYLVYPIAASDPRIWPLYVIGAFSLLGSLGVLKMTRWGLWLGLGLFLPQIIVPIYAINFVLPYPSVTQRQVYVTLTASVAL